MVQIAFTKLETQYSNKKNLARAVIAILITSASSGT